MAMTVIENAVEWRQPVITMPLIQAFPELEKLDLTLLKDHLSDFKQYNEKKVVLSEDHSRLFGVFGRKSIIVPHQDLVEILGDVYYRLYNEDGVARVISHKNGAQVIITMELPLKTPLDVGNGDVCNLLIHATNSYDKGLSLKIQTGIMRLVCSNGAVLGTNIASINAREMFEGFNTKTLSAKVNRMIDKSKQVTDVWQRWMETPIQESIVQRVMGHVLPKKFVEPLLDRLTYPINKYALYNEVTRRATHDVRDDHSRYIVDNIIARIFYGNKLESCAMTMQAQRENMSSIPDDYINATVFETDDITH